MAIISIITVCYNSRRTIAATIESVLAQKNVTIEYIIIDGMSSDGTMDVISRYQGKIAKIVHEPDGGMYDAMNKGISHATGEVIGIINSDDIYADEYVVFDVLEKFKNTGADSVYGDLEYVDADNTAKIMRIWKSGTIGYGKIRRGWMPPHPAFFVRKKCYCAYGGFMLNLGTSADYELMLRLLMKHKITTAYCERVLVRMRVGGVSNSQLKNQIIAHRMDRKAWRKNGLTPFCGTIIWKPLRKIPGIIIARLGLVKPAN